MLLLYTQLQDTQWLRYILDEFLLVSRAKFKIEITADKNFPQNIPAIAYSSETIEKVPSVYFGNLIQPDNNFIWKSNSFFLINNTFSSNSQFEIEYDVFWNSFVHLSRIEEWNSEKSGNLIRSYSFRHPRKDKRTFHFPVVNYYFSDLKKLIKKHYPQLLFSEDLKSEIEWSHDLDYINKTLQLRLKQTAFNTFNTMRGIGKQQLGLKFKKTFSFFFTNPGYWLFDYWKQTEMKAGIRSVFYIYSKAKLQKNTGNFFTSFIINPSYNVSINKKLQKELKQLHEDGFKIGLHGSFFSAENFNLLENEKVSLEKSLGIKIHKGRQHWLCYREEKTPQIHEQLFSEDSTLGWNDIPGFRSGIATPYHPYNHSEKRAFRYMVIPQMIMDSHFFDYGNHADTGFQILKRFFETENAKASVSWHPHTCSDDYKWHYLYEKFLEKARVE